MHRARMSHSNPLSFDLRQRIIFNRLPANEKLFIRLREGVSNHEKLKASIKCGKASVAKYHLNQILTSNEDIDAQILLSEKNIFFHPIILKLLLNASIDSNRLSLEHIRSSLTLVTYLYVNLKRIFDTSPTQGNRSRVDALIKSSAILIHHAEGWTIIDAYSNNNGQTVDLNDVESENSMLLTNFQLSINQVQYHDIESNIEASSPEFYCSITDDSRKRINSYDRGQFEEINIIEVCQQATSCLYRLFSPCISFAVTGYNNLMAEKSNADLIGSFDDPNIPEEYLCQITQEIMTNPVYDKNHTQYKFERSEILKALSIKEQNPYTRTALHETDLIDDLELKGKINLFINSLYQGYEATSLIESTP